MRRLLTLAIGCGTMLAQDPAGYYLALPWSHGPVQSATAGNFTHAGRKSVAALSNGEVYLLYWPTQFRSINVLSAAGNNVTGVVAIPRINSSQDRRDRLLVTRTTGLPLILRYNEQAYLANPSQGAFSLDPDVAPLLPSMNGAWNGANKLIARKEAGGIVRIAGRSANGQSLVIGRQKMNLPTIETDAKVPLGSNINAIEIMDYDGNGVFDYIACTDSGMTIINPSGSIIATAMTGQRILGACTMKVGGDRLAVYTYEQSTGALRATVGWAGGIIGTSDLPMVGSTEADQTPISVSSFDIDGNGYSETLVHQAGSSNFLYTRPIGSPNQVNRCIRGPESWPHLMPTEPVPQMDPHLNTAPTLWTDFNGNGLPDVVYFDNSLGTVVIRADAVGFDPFVAPITSVFADAGPILDAVYDSHNLHFKVASTLAPPGSTIDLKVWFQATPSAPLNSNPVDLQVNVPAVAGGTVFHVPMQPQPLPPSDPTDPDAIYWWPDHPHYFLDITVRSSNPSENRHLLAGLTMRTSEDEQDFSLQMHLLYGVKPVPGEEMWKIQINHPEDTAELSSLLVPRGLVTPGGNSADPGPGTVSWASHIFIGVIITAVVPPPTQTVPVDADG